MEHLWGIDCGGTKLEAIVLDRSNVKKPLARVRIPTEASKGYEHILSRMKHLRDTLQQETGLTCGRIGVGHPGSIDPSTHILRNSNTTCLNGKALADDLAVCLGIPVTSANDANCFTLAEARLGAANNAECVFGVILGTGVGGGIALNGKIIEGSHSLSGEWGHNPLDEAQGPACYCGRKGCVETIISGPALEAFYDEKTGVCRSFDEIVKRASQELAAQETLNRFHFYFGKAIAGVINILDPDCIVCGGGLSNIQSLYSESLQSLQNYVFHETYSPNIVPNTLGDSAGVFGAALLTTMRKDGTENTN